MYSIPHCSHIHRHMSIHQSIVTYCDFNIGPPSLPSVMADQSASVACLLLLLALLPPSTLAQDDDCYYSYLPYYNVSSLWPDCLLSRLTNRLNATYYIRPDGSEVENIVRHSLCTV